MKNLLFATLFCGWTLACNLLIRQEEVAIPMWIVGCIVIALLFFHDLELNH